MKTLHPVEKNAIQVFVASKILTMNPSQPEATHVAVREGKILAVGSLEDVSQWGPVELIETFADKVLMPGMVEGHCHLMEGAMWDALYVGFYDRHGPDGKLWAGLKTLDAVIERLDDMQRTMTADPNIAADVPLLAWGFDPIFFGTERLSVHELDRVSNVRPIVILHASVHLMNVNSAMLHAAGIDADTDIDGIDLDAQGEPTGELQEFAAMFPVFRAIGDGLSLSGSEKPKAIWNFGRVAQLAGVTTATDLFNDYSALGNSNLETVCAHPDFPIRIVPAFAPQRNSEGGAHSVVEARAATRKSANEKLHFGPVKFIVDGSIQGFTARLKWPGYFNGKPNGLWLIPPSQFVEAFLPFHLAGLQLHIHTNGDEATELVLDALETILNQYPQRDHRHTLQHCQMAGSSQLQRAARLGLCINFFSNHLYYWGDAHYAQTMGPDRANRMNPAGTAHRLGIPIAFHSDAPITQLRPLFTAWCATQRETASGRILGEEERIGKAEALHAITLGAAYTLKLDHVIGSIEVGKFADFAVLDRNPLDGGTASFKDVEVWGTVLSGKIFPAPRGET